MNWAALIVQFYRVKGKRDGWARLHSIGRRGSRDSAGAFSRRHRVQSGPALPLLQIEGRNRPARRGEPRPPQEQEDTTAPWRLDTRPRQVAHGEGGHHHRLAPGIAGENASRQRPRRGERAPDAQIKTSRTIKVHDTPSLSRLSPGRENHAPLVQPDSIWWLE